MSKQSLTGAVLSIPGTRLELFEKAFDTGASALILDLEDSVTPANKGNARAAVSNLLQSGDSRLAGITIRVNAIGSSWWREDVKSVATSAKYSYRLMIPKVNSVNDLRLVEQLIRNHTSREQLDAPVSSLIALIESAIGLEQVGAIAQAGESLEGLAIGYADLAADLGRTAPSPRVNWSWTRERTLLAGRANRLTVLDGPSLSTAVDEDFRSDVETAVDTGMDGKWVIHPRQVSLVQKAFTPSDADVGRALAILRALSGAVDHGAGAIMFEGQMIDEAVAVGARRIVKKYRLTPR